MVNMLSSVEVLRNKELSQKFYQCRDYLNSSSNGVIIKVTPGTRVEMLQWVQKVSLYMKTSDDLALLTATLLDKFCQTPRGQELLTSTPDFRLATMACLYLTAKVNDPNVSISSEVMSAFSQGMFSAKQVEEAELEILMALNFYVHPPNALAFVREFLLLLPCSVSKSIKEQAYNHCQTQIQRCMLDYNVFVTNEASTIAFFAVQNALKSLGMDPIICGHIASIFSYATHTDYYCGDDDNNSKESMIIQSSLMGEREGGSPQRKRRRRSHHRRGSDNDKKRGRNSSSTTSSISSTSFHHHHHQQQYRRSSMSSSSTTAASRRQQSWSRRSSSLHSSFNESPCGVVH